MFFDKIFTLFDADTIKNHLMDFNEDRNIIICKFNLYLRNRNTYYIFRDLLKKDLHKFKLTFINQDIYKFESENKFDNILLSNLSTYYEMEEHKKLLEKLSDNLNEEGKMLITYLWDIDFDFDYYNDDWNKMYNMPLVREYFKEFISEHYKIKDSTSILNGTKKENDLILVYKKN